MQLPFEPACRTLLLGSLPYRSAAQAISIARQYSADVVVWPHLPQRSFRETSIVQSAAGFPGLVVDAQHRRVYVQRAQAEAGLDRLGLAYLQHDVSYAALADEDASGLSELHRQRESLRSVHVIKGQLMGPISLASHLTDEEERPLIYDDVLFEALTHHLYLRAAWQAAQMAELCERVILCLDEPFLDAAALPFLPLDWQRVEEAIDEVFSAVDGVRAIFTIRATRLQPILQTSVDLLMADAVAPGSALYGDGEAVADLLRRGGMLGLGAVPTGAEELERGSAEQLADTLEHALEQLAPNGLSAVGVLRRSFLTPQDSLGQVAPEVAEGALQRLAQLSALLRERHALE
jgi:hypothetical protein